MKNELKISILSIACVLCTTMAMPALGASSVRSLGGAGTYASASSAASAKSGANGGSAINSVRGGSMRVNTSTNNASGSTRTSTSRATTTPRLSIGKYLAGSSAVSGGSSDKVEGELSQLTGNLQQRIRILEQFMGYSSTGDDIPEQFKAIQVDIEKLKDDVAALSAGEVTDVTYEDGVLTVVNGGDEMTYDLSKDFAGMSEIAALETALDDLESKLADYAKLSDLDGLLTSADLSELEDAIDALELVDASMDSAIKALQGGMVAKEDLNDKVSELSQVDAGLQAAIDALKNTMPSTEGLVNKDYVDNAVAGLESADAALQDAIDAIVRPDVDKAYVDAAIAGLNTAITELRAADTSMGQAIADLQSRMANVATRDDIKDFVTSDYVTDAIKDLATKSDIQDFVKSGDFQAEIAKLATKEQIADFVTSDVVTKSIADATKDLLTADDVADFVTSGDMAAAITNATSDLVTTAELNTAKSELQAAIDKISAGDIDLTNYYTKAEADAKFATKAEIPSVDGFVKSADLAVVATSGSYDDLSGKPTIPSIEGLASESYVTSALASKADASALADAVDALEAADSAMDVAIKALQGGMITEGDLNAKVSELTQADKALQDALAELEENMPSIEGLAEKTYVDGLVSSLELADSALQSAIDAIEKPDVNKAYVDAAIADLNTAITGLQAADTSMGQTVESLQASLNTMATKQELADVKSELQAAIDGIDAGDIDLTNYYTKAEADAKFATKAEIPSVDGFVKSADLAAVATSGLYDDLSGKPTIPSIEGLASESYVTSALASKADASALADAVADLQALIDDKQAAGDYLVAADLATLEAAVAALGTDKADTSTVAALQSAVDNLGDKYATDSEISAAVAAVEAKIPTVPTVVSAFTNDAGYITDAALTDYAKSADVTSALASKADASALADAVDALEAADSAMDVAIEALQGGMITEGDLNAKVSELTQADKALQDALAELEANMPSIEGLAEKTYVDGLVSGLELADSALQSAIDAIEKPDVNKAYVDAAIANLNTAITGLQAADTSMGQTVESLQASLNSMATKQELADVKSELQAAIDGINAGDVELTNYYTKAEADAQFATKDELAAKQDTLTPGVGITITDNTISATVDTSSLITKPAEQPDMFGEYVLILNINEAGESEGYSWLDTQDLMGGGGFDM